MRRIISTLMVLLLICTVLPIKSFAEEAADTEREALIELACDVFPEYESAIRGEGVSTYGMMRSDGEREVVFRETRTISDELSVGITQFSTGEVIIVENYSTAFMIEESNTSVTDFSVGYSVQATFTVTSNVQPGTFELSNVVCTIYEYSDDYFTNYGTMSVTANVAAERKEATSTNIKYDFTFGTAAAGSNKEYGSFEVAISNNQLVAFIW